MIFVTQKKSVYVDSVAGSDANDGLTTTTPKATCAAGMTVLASSGRKTIRLKCGSFFREVITLPPGKRLKTYGSGARPILDPRENVAGTWTLSSGYTYVYQQTVPHGLYDACTHRIWEDGTRMLRVATMALCESTAGSFFVEAPSGTTGTFYIHPTGGGDPNSNGKTYSYSYRMWGVELLDGCVVDGIKTGWNGGNDGSIRALARNVVIRNCDAFDGAKHHILISEGLVENCNCYDAEPIPGAGNAIAIIAYNNFTTGKSSGVIVRKCTVDYVTFTTTSSIGVYGHGGLGSERLVVEDCVFKNISQGVGDIACDVIIVSRCVGINCTTLVYNSTGAANVYIYRCREIGNAAVAANPGCLANGSFKSLRIRHSEVVSVNYGIALRAAGTSGFDVRYCNMSNASGGTIGPYMPGTGQYTFSNCLMWGTGKGVYNKTDTVLFNGDYNLLWPATNQDGSNSLFALGGTAWNVTQWRSATGGDVHSLFANPLLVSLANESSFSTFNQSGPVYTSGFPVGVQPTDDAETLALLASVGYTP